MPADAISRALGVQPWRGWTAGEDRTTPDGTHLGGVRDATYWSYRLPNGKEVCPSDQIRSHLPELQRIGEFLRSFVESGGSIDYFIGWFTGRMSGDTFDWNLLEELAELKINIDFDVYGDFEAGQRGQETATNPAT